MTSYPMSSNTEGEEANVEVRELRVWPEQCVATLDGRELQLTQKELLLLALFIKNRGRVLRRERIAAEVWGGNAPGRTIDVHVARLRSKLPAGAIATVVRVGYRFVLA